MPILRVKEIQDMSTDERTKRLSELKTELLRLKTMTSAGGTVENPARIKELRKTIARILTIENEQKLGLRKAKPEKKPKPKEKKTKSKEKKAKPKEKKEK
jgi:large subunit ribosomal protein L29